MLAGLMKLWRQGFPCLFHLYTGLYCPGCGGTRAVKALLRGELWLSFRYHPIVLYAAAVILLECTSWALARALNRPRLFIRQFLLFTYVGIGIILFHWGFKDFMLAVRGVDLMP